MGILLYLNTDTSYMELENLQELKITQSFNEHGILTLTALIQEEVKTKYATEIKPYEIVEVVVGEEGNYKTLFKGIVKNIEIHQIKKAYYLFVTAATGSYKMDLEIRSRSFQNKDMTYTQLFQTIASEYTQGDTADFLTNDEKIENLIVQYRETDWEFFKRITSRFFGGVVPALQYDAPKITLGKPQGTNRGEIEKYNFHVNKDLKRFLISSKNGNEELTQLDVITFFIETTDEFDIGDCLTYFDKASNLTYTDFYIKSKEIEMVEGTLRFRYSLCSENGFMLDKIYNEKIAGVSLKGEVLERINDTVKVKLEIDDTQDTGTAWQFSYTTPYTAGGYSGWYIMPEVGDTVLIYFPNKEEENAVGLNSIRVKNTGNDKIGNPEIKYLRTASGKEIKLAPDELTITCSNWVDKETGEKNKIYIQLKDSKGITIESTKSVYINSDADINFTADKKIMIAAEDKIKFKCKLEITEELNEHGTASINLTTNDISKCKFIYDLTYEKDIKVVSVSDDETEIIFIGIPIKLEVKNIKDIYYINIELRSKSFLLDCELKRKSFQNEKNPIENIFKRVIEEDNNGIYFDAVSDGALQNESIIQYDETDWNFIKRVASKLEANIVTNVKDNIPHITIGLQRGSNYNYNTYNDTLRVDMQDYLQSHLNFGEWTPEQKTNFCIDSINNYWIYDNILYKNILLTIVKKKTVYTKGMIFFNYLIKTESGVRQNHIINEKIKGISIDGKILDIIGDRVKLHLFIDKIQNPHKAFWYKMLLMAALKNKKQYFYSKDGKMISEAITI